MTAVNKELQLAFANMMVEKMWVNGLLTDEQKKKICERNFNKIYS